MGRLEKFSLIDGITGKVLDTFYLPRPDPKIVSLRQPRESKSDSYAGSGESRRYFIPGEDLGYDHTMVEAQMTCCGP